MKTIREQINDFLTFTGMPACRLADESGVSAANISRLRSGKRSDCASRVADSLRHAMKRLDPKAAAYVMAE